MADVRQSRGSRHERTFVFRAGFRLRVGWLPRISKSATLEAEVAASLLIGYDRSITPQPDHVTAGIGRR